MDKNEIQVVIKFFYLRKSNQDCSWGFITLIFHCEFSSFGIQAHKWWTTTFKTSKTTRNCKNSWHDFGRSPNKSEIEEAVDTME